jgi:hypothetical protein
LRPPSDPDDVVVGPPVQHTRSAARASDLRTTSIVGRTITAVSWLIEMNARGTNE